MKQIVLKNERHPLLILFMLSAIAFYSWLLISIMKERCDTLSSALIWVIMLMIMVTPCIILIVSTLRDSRVKIIVTEDGLTYIRGRKILQSIKKGDIIAYGCVSYHIETAHPGSIFFCYATAEDICAEAKKYWHWRKSLYSKAQLEELEKTLAGMWILQMSVYFRMAGFDLIKRHKIICSNTVRKENLQAIWELWQREPMLLGTIARYNPHRFI